ncbi:hypothetical protein DUZ99_14320 [Xylanibacillus composti]|nr:hypothetical protein [Xylanibacillus composti]
MHASSKQASPFREQAPPLFLLLHSPKAFSFLHGPLGFLRLYLHTKAFSAILKYEKMAVYIRIWKSWEGA